MAIIFLVIILNGKEKNFTCFSVQLAAKFSARACKVIQQISCSRTLAGHFSNLGRVFK